MSQANPMRPVLLPAQPYRTNPYAAGFLGAKVLKDFARRLPQSRIPGRYQNLALQRLRPFFATRAYALTRAVFPVALEGPLANRQTTEDQTSLMPGTFLLGFAGDSEQSEGFRFNVIENLTQTQLFQKDVNNAGLAGMPVSPASAANPFWLSPPHCFPDGGQLVVTLTNLAQVDNLVQLVVLLAVPRQSWAAWARQKRKGAQ